MVGIAICDKNELVREQVISLAGQIPEVKRCGGYANPQSFLRFLKMGDEECQILFMGLEWDEETDMAVLFREIGELSPGIKIVCMAERPSEYIQHIFLQTDSLCGFLKKPLDEELVMAYILKLTAEERLDMLLIRNKGALQPIPLRDILYMESSGHLIEIQTRTERYSCYGRLQKLLEKLSADFLQCHKSYIVNMREICRIEGKRITMSDGLMVPISKSRYGETKERYSHYMN